MSIFKMSRWDDYNPDETYDPNKDYSVQVQRNDGGLSATQDRFRTLTLGLNFFSRLADFFQLQFFK